MKGVDLTAIIGIVFTFISLLLAFFLLTVRSQNKISNNLFAVFLILTVLDISGWYMHLFVSGPSTHGMMINILSYLQIPVFYFYVLSVCYSDFRLKKKHLLHAIPYIIGNIVLLPRFYLATAKEKSVLIENYNSLYELIYIHISLHVQFIIYITAAFMVLYKFKAIYTENYSNSSSGTFIWLFQLTLVSAVAHFFVIIKNFLKYYDKENSFETAQLFVGVFALAIICWYVLKALKNPEIFNGVNSKIPLVNKLISKGNASILPEDEKQIQQLKIYMEKEEPFLDPSLTINNLANQMQTSTRDLSVLINHSLNQHFFDFVNEYRIKKAMHLLKDPSKAKFTVLEILYEVGFNSKSSFNTAFKKQTGLTPTQYRKS